MAHSKKGAPPEDEGDGGASRGVSDLELSAVPRRFWTPTLARLAIDQGRWQVAIDVVDALVDEADEGAREELLAIAEDARAKRHVEQASRRRAATIRRLDRCLDRARTRRRDLARRAIP